jgi:hypothetical protein
MTSALLTVPSVVLTLVLAGKTGTFVKVAEAFLLLTGTVLLVVLMLTFQRLLSEKFAFFATDQAIALFIKANIVSAVVGGIGFAFPAIEESTAVFGIIMVMVIGLLQTWFGFKLLQLPDSLGGLLRPYCYINILTGCCTAVVFLIPLGIVASAVGDVMLGTIFFKAAHEIRQAVNDEGVS